MESPESSCGRKPHASRYAPWAKRIVIEANAAGLRTLAGHLLTLAQDGTPDGTHLHLEEHNGLEEGSASLVLERCDE